MSGQLSTSTLTHCEMSDSFATRDTLSVNGSAYTIFSLAKLGRHFDLSRLPFSMKILLENLLRCEDGVAVTSASIQAVAQWNASDEPATEIAFMPARVLLQDFTGLPCVVDFAAMRAAVVKLGEAVYLRDIWPSNQEIGDLIASNVKPEMFKRNYANVFAGDSRWNRITAPDGAAFEWNTAPTYIKNPPYYAITTDHISPAGNIKADSPAGRFLPVIAESFERIDRSNGAMSRSTSLACRTAPAGWPMLWPPAPTVAWPANRPFITA
jgi:aconitase A